MRTRRMMTVLVVMAFAALFAAFPVLAANGPGQGPPPGNQPPGGPGPGHEQGPPPQHMGSQQSQDQMGAQGQFVPERASHIMGAPVRNERGQMIGRAKDIIFNQNARPVYLVLSHAGRLIPVPFDNVRFNPKNNEVIIPNLTTAALEKAPCFSTWNLLGNPRFENEIHSYYGGMAAGGQGGPGPQGEPGIQQPMGPGPQGGPGMQPQPRPGPQGAPQYQGPPPHQGPSPDQQQR
jgi:hypothetical protein